MQAAIHLLERQEIEAEAKIAALRQAVEIGEEAFRRGDYDLVPDDESLEDMFADIAQDVCEPE